LRGARSLGERGARCVVRQRDARQRSLWVCIYRQHTLAHLSGKARQIEHSGCFSDAALKIGDRNHVVVSMMSCHQIPPLEQMLTLRAQFVYPKRKGYTF
jgi:hypothetical protein